METVESVAGAVRASVLSHQEAQWAKETLQETQAGLWLSGKTRWTGSE